VSRLSSDAHQKVRTASHYFSLLTAIKPAKLS
jgi:hypothetical protein